MSALPPSVPFPARARDDANQLLVALLMAIAAMLFAAFSAAYVIRRTGSDWLRVPMPALAWVSTVLVLACSAAAERARRRPAPWSLVTLALGLSFVVSQVLVWIVIAAGGAFSANPHRAFLLMLTAVHAAHVLAALALTVAAGLPGGTGKAGPCAAWWHFVDAVWLYLVVLLWLI